MPSTHNSSPSCSANDYAELDNLLEHRSSAVGSDCEELTAVSQQSRSIDAKFLARVQRGDEQAMADLFDRYSKIVYSIALRVLRDTAFADDILQETFMQIWHHPCKFTPARANLGCFLAVFTRNRSIDALRRRKPTDEVEGLAPASSINLADETERNLLMKRARTAILLLPAEQRKTLEMAVFDGCTHSEIAERTGDPLGTVKTRIRDGLLILRQAIQT